MPAIPFLSPSPIMPKACSLSSNTKQTFHSYTSISNSKPPDNSKPSNHPSYSPKSFSIISNKENPDFRIPFESNSRSDSAIKMPTPPWMTGPLVLPPHEVVDISKPGNKKNSNSGRDENPGGVLSDKLVGRRGKNVIKKIARNIEMLGKTIDLEDTQSNYEELGIGVGLERIGEVGNSRIGGKMPWDKDESFVFRRTKKIRPVSAAELSLDKELLERLRGEAAKMRKWVKVKKAGVTQAVVDNIKLIWKTNELAMVKFDIPLSRNMDRAQEIVEMKTGGMVVWNRKDALVVYRGCNYQPTQKTMSKMYPGFTSSRETPSSSLVSLDLEKGNSVCQAKSYENTSNEKMSNKNTKGESFPTGIILENDAYLQPTSSSLYEREADRLLAGLGPRFVDWWMRKPLPVDADLLPEVVPGFRPPFRRSPPRTRSKLTDDEFTYLRKLAHPLPTHFVLGRNRKLQGLAAAILKLWEKSPIAKIAVKLGTPNTNNEQMAYELKCLTGGVLLLRNKFIIILYRGNDFVPSGIADLILKREKELEKFQLYEEHARLEGIETFCAADEPQENTSSTGTLYEFQNIQVGYNDQREGNTKVKLQFEAEKERLERELRNQEHKLSILNSKIEKSSKDLLKLNAEWAPAEPDTDKELLTEEERECFRKIGLKMHSLLLLGRRGVFDGVMEGLHQHWKHREVAKVITMQRLFRQVMYTAKLLEAESGGILVSVDKLKEGYAIIIYRGKNYQRPAKLTPGNLLSKRKALHRSLEMQRLGVRSHFLSPSFWFRWEFIFYLSLIYIFSSFQSLKYFAYQREQAISDLKLQLVRPKT
ncbi:hypothetical protein UlMin_014271 [Ulmus minor]